MCVYVTNGKRRILTGAGRRILRSEFRDRVRRFQDIVVSVGRGEVVSDFRRVRHTGTKPDGINTAATSGRVGVAENRRRNTGC